MLVSGFFGIACEQDESVTTGQIYHGAVYIQCEVGPEYYFSLDSLVANCSSADSFEVALPAVQTCFYDNNPSLAASPTDYDFLIFRDPNDWQIMNLVMADSTAQVDWIPFVVIDGDIVNAQNHPLYNAYRVSWTDKILHLYIFNRYLGGCLHDEVVWHLEQN